MIFKSFNHQVGGQKNKITNITGQVIYKKSDNSESIVFIEIKESGFYFIKIMDDQKYYNQMIIKF